MPKYRFRTLPRDGEEDVEVEFANDEEALVDARRALGDLLQDEAQAGKSISKDIEVRREDGSLVGSVTSHTP
jgi:hypothetical protein